MHIRNTLKEVTSEVKPAFPTPGTKDKKCQEEALISVVQAENDSGKGVYLIFHDFGRIHNYSACFSTIM